MVEWSLVIGKLLMNFLRSCAPNYHDQQQCECDDELRQEQDDE